MNIAVLLPAKSNASDGLIKHINCIIKEWLLSDMKISLTIYLPEGLAILSPSLPVKTVYFPRNDFWSGFKALSALVTAGIHDVALVLIARQVALGALPVVTMVQNVEPLQQPDYKITLKWRLRLWALRREHRIACHKATRVLVTTDYVKRCLVENLQVNSKKIDVIHFGIYQSEADNLGNPPRDIMNLQPGSFLFTAGSMVPYRGIEDLVYAYGILAKTGTGTSLPLLVIAGEDNTPYGREIKSLAATLGVSKNLRWLGKISSEEMNWCYKQCRVFVLTSRAESFCNIALEAMGNGCICVVCDHDPLPEVCKDVPFYYRWGDADGLASSLRTAMNLDACQASQLKQRARLRSTNFSWAQIAKDTLLVLEKAIN